MRRTATMAALAMAGLLTGACADSPEDEMEMEMDAGAEVDETMPTEPAAPGEAVAANLSVESLPEGGAYLTDAQGRALYLLEGEPEGESTCYDACAEEWPPFLAQNGGMGGATGMDEGAGVGDARTDGTAAGTEQAPADGTDATTDQPGMDRTAADRAGMGAQTLRPELVGTLERTDGSTQVTYDGHALYYYHDDQGQGQTAGQDVTDQWGEWYLVRPSGEPLEEGGQSP